MQTRMMAAREEGGREGWREDDGEVRRAEGGDRAVNAMRPRVLLHWKEDCLAAMK
jgi:hypothetical protein